jgi:hypothetical protein
MSDMWFRYILFPSNSWSKISYFDCHRRWFPQKHKFKQDQNAFKKDTIVTKGPSKCLRGAQIVDILDKLMPDPEIQILDR